MYLPQQCFRNNYNKGCAISLFDSVLCHIDLCNVVSSQTNWWPAWTFPIRKMCKLIKHTAFSMRVFRRAIIYLKLLHIVLLFGFLQVYQCLSMPVGMPMTYRYNHNGYQNDGQYMKEKPNYSTSSISNKQNALTVEDNEYYTNLNSILGKSKKTYVFKTHGGLKNKTVT